MTSNDSSKTPTDVEKKNPTASVPKKKGWSNPALRMMGIPRISLPSRNWLIFWAVCIGIGSGIAYDKYQQSQIREKWMNEVKHLGDEKYDTSRIPRKVTVFIAPPPNDFLDVSLKLFRKYIKPVLNAGAVDMDLFSENRQGDIRSTVASKIRELRLERIKEKEEAEKALIQQKYDESWTKYFKETVPGYFKRKNEAEEILVKRQDLYKPTDVLGLYRITSSVEPHRDDESDLLNAGGVICIGRGAYKEYMAGVHEGLLGPLEKPKELIEEEEKIKQEKEKEKEGEDASQNNNEDDDELEPVPKPYISQESYANAELAPELDFSSVIKNKKNVPVLFEQPCYVFDVPNVLGFLNTPKKIYRYFTKRYLADDFGFRTTTIVYNKTRPFEYKDSMMAKEEELDWPKKWVQMGKEKNSEWVQELVLDERITSRMRVFDPQLLSKDNKDL